MSKMFREINLQQLFWVGRELFRKVSSTVAVRLDERGTWSEEGYQFDANDSVVVYS